jgi:hypothetical protein
MSNQQNKVIEFPIHRDQIRRFQFKKRNGVPYSIYHIYPLLSGWKPKEVPDNNNPRSHKENILGKGVAMDIEGTLNGVNGIDPSDFHLANRGCTIFVDEVRYDPKTSICQIILADYEGSNCAHGMADGATTDAVLAKFKRENIGDDVLEDINVHLEVIEGLSDKDSITSLSQGRNTSQQVKKWSLADFGNQFNWLKKILEGYSGVIGYDENEGKDVTILDVIAIINLFNPYYGTGNEETTSPTISYSGKANLVDHFLNPSVQRGFLSLDNIIIEILDLHDYVISKYQETYSRMRKDKDDKTGGRLFALKGANNALLFKSFDKTRKVTQKLNFSDYQTNIKKLPTSMLYPILGSMRCLLEIHSDGKMGWKRPPREFFDKHGASIMKVAFDQFETAARNNPNAFGKTAPIYQTIYYRTLNFV